MFAVTAESGQRRHKQGKSFDFSVVFFISDCIFFRPRIMHNFQRNIQRQSS